MLDSHYSLQLLQSLDKWINADVSGGFDTPIFLILAKLRHRMGCSAVRNRDMYVVKICASIGLHYCLFVKSRSASRYSSGAKTSFSVRPSNGVLYSAYLYNLSLCVLCTVKGLKGRPSDMVPSSAALINQAHCCKVKTVCSAQRHFFSKASRLKRLTFDLKCFM